MDRVEKLYRNVANTEGSQHIASEYAIRKLLKLVREFNISSILEVGLGIGSISSIILQLNSQIKIYDGTEENVFCLNVLDHHLQKDRLRIFSNLNEIPKSKYELVIIDGKDNSLEDIKHYITEEGIIAIEGDRVNQVETVIKLFPKQLWVHSISLKRNRIYAPFTFGEWQGGIKIIFVNPSIKQKLWWAREKTLTFLKYKVPGRYLG